MHADAVHRVVSETLCVGALARRHVIRRPYERYRRQLLRDLPDPPGPGGCGKTERPPGQALQPHAGDAAR